jgi:hypothetical protein
VKFLQRVIKEKRPYLNWLSLQEQWETRNAPGTWLFNVMVFLESRLGVNLSKINTGLEVLVNLCTCMNNAELNAKVTIYCHQYCQAANVDLKYLLHNDYSLLCSLFSDCHRVSEKLLPLISIQEEFVRIPLIMLMGCNRWTGESKKYVGFSKYCTCGEVMVVDSLYHVLFVCEFLATIREIAQRRLGRAWSVKELRSAIGTGDNSSEAFVLMDFLCEASRIRLKEWESLACQGENSVPDVPANSRLS